jgi:hypothetical protein
MRPPRDTPGLPAGRRVVRDDVNAITGVAGGLLIVGSVLNLTTMVHSPASDNTLPWQAKWMA